MNAKTTSPTKKGIWLPIQWKDFAKVRAAARWTKHLSILKDWGVKSHPAVTLMVESNSLSLGSLSHSNC